MLGLIKKLIVRLEQIDEFKQYNFNKIILLDLNYIGKVWENTKK